jgi:plasmid maintenance system antidote protein VapI
LLRVFCESGWLRRAKDSRAVDVTPKGWLELKRHFDLDEARLRAA